MRHGRSGGKRQVRDSVGLNHNEALSYKMNECATVMLARRRESYGASLETWTAFLDKPSGQTSLRDVTARDRLTWWAKYVTIGNHMSFL